MLTSHQQDDWFELNDKLSRPQGDHQQRDKNFSPSPHSSSNIALKKSNQCSHHHHPHQAHYHHHNESRVCSKNPDVSSSFRTSSMTCHMVHVILALTFIQTSIILNANGQVKLINPLPPAPPPQIIVTDDFSPLVTARCDRGVMHITVVTQQPFYGVAHTREQRKPPCMAQGDGSFNTTLKISLLAQPDDELYCGVQRYQGERSVSLAVRAHRTLELSEDRFFYLTCQSGYKNVKGGTYRVTLKLIDDNTQQRATRLIHGLPYLLRAELTPKDSVTTLRMKNCFVFTKQSDHVELIDRSGCPAISGLITPFTYNDSSTGEARIPEMFKFPEEGKIHFQCDALLCRENCDEPDCDGTSKVREYELDGYSQVSASTSVFIREPSDLDALVNPDSGELECTEWRFPWLITLCICLAIMLLVMLLLNLFMCSSLTCRCIKTEVNEKEPVFDEELDDYDPYRADWTAPNSLHGSRYSLEKARNQQQQQHRYHESDDTGSTSSPDYDNESLEQRHTNRPRKMNLNDNDDLSQIDGDSIRQQPYHQNNFKPSYYDDHRKSANNPSHHHSPTNHQTDLKQRY